MPGDAFRRILLLMVGAVFLASSGTDTPARIVYTHAPGSGRPWPREDVYSIREDGSGGGPLTNDGHSHDASWSPDGKRILFIHDSVLRKPPPYREDGFETYHPVELEIMDSDGRKRHLVRRLEPVIYSAVWSPNNKMIAVSWLRDAPEPGLFLLSADGTGEPALIAQNAFTPTWSPDGNKLAFSEEKPRGRWTLAVVNSDGTGLVRLTDDAHGAGSPAWSPDGRRIAFDQFLGSGGRQQIFVVNPDGTGVRQLTTDPGWSCTHAAWSPDGKRIVYGARSASAPCGMGFYSNGQPMPDCTRRLFIVGVDGPTEKPTALGRFDGCCPAWAPVR